MSLFNFKEEHYLSKEILLQLDECAKKFTFPMLDNGYVYLVDSRLSLYRDKKRWGLIIEIVGFNYRAGGHDGIDNCLYVFGNCIDFEPGTNNSNFIYFTDNSNDGETFDDAFGESLNLDTRTMLLRGKSIPVLTDPEIYKSQGIELEEPPQIKIWEFLRVIRYQYRDSFLATEEELRHRIPRDLPCILQLNEWFHPDLANGERPSECETFQMIAKVLETGNTSYYAPTRPYNNHWKNWPEGGTL